MNILVFYGEWISTTCYISFTSVQFYIITPLYVQRILQLCVFLLLSKLYVDCTQDKSEMTSIKYMYISSVWGMIGNVNMILFSLKKNDVTLVKETDHTTVYPKKYAHGFCFVVLCCGYTLTDFPVSIRLTSLALWQSNDCPSASKATLMNMDKYFMWIHYERLHNHNKAKHNKTVCIFLGIYCKTQLYYIERPKRK